MAKKENVLIDGAFGQFDEVVKRFLDTVPKQLNAPVLKPPAGKKTNKPQAYNPFRGT
jgi:hypothetical protein